VASVGITIPYSLPCPFGDVPRAAFVRCTYG
jgi:hypothetical protein